MTFHIFYKVCFFLFIAFCFTRCESEPTHRVLVFSKTNGFRHASIEAGAEALRQLGTAQHFLVETTEDSSYFTEEKLKDFAAVVFLNTSGDILNYRQKADFQRFIEAGGGFVGIHGAAATEYDWRWYGHLVGGYLLDHPKIQKADLHLADAANPANSGLPAAWSWTEEWYNFRPVPPTDKVFLNIPAGREPRKETKADTLMKKDPNVAPELRFDFSGNGDFLSKNAKVLLAVDEKTYTGGKHGASHPIAWTQEYEGGRSFYTALGHSAASYQDSIFRKHLLGGLRFALGNGTLDYSKTKTERVPPEDRFVRTVLAENLDEPMEIAIFPDGKIILVERKGAIKIFDPATDTLDTVCILPVYHEFEEGIMGVAIDPNYVDNKWIYLYYSLMEGGRRNRLSRFVFDNNQLQLSSEKMMLEVPEQVGCCHTGGSMDFDSKGNLFLSTGDNTNPFESDGFAPMDERADRALWDAQRSSGNPNDLRGKILRITPQDDGTYTIPEGNLFPKGMAGTRPEIFVMGCRNPFRIAVDSQTDAVFWGDVGPDAGKDGAKRGSKGYDTFARAAKAGNYGWPFVRGNHIYNDYSFSQNSSTQRFDPERIINNSPHNTGKRELPPVQAPMIWYSYDESLEFPWTATGGKNPMAGPIFHAADFDKKGKIATTGQSGQTIFPPYFEGKFFVYEWMRNWIYLVTFDESGRYEQADPFLPNEKFSRPMDMAFGPDGALYVLEYGERWFAQNPDARLNRIEFAPGNRRPIAKIEASKTVGSDPLTVHLSGSSSIDYDKEPLQYEWVFKDGRERRSTPTFDYVFTLPGTYKVTLKVTDPHGVSSRASTEIIVGNTPPTIAWNLKGNQTFYWDNEEVPYYLEVKDPEDGSIQAGTLDNRRVRASIDYLPQGQDVAAIILGHQTQESAAVNLKFAKGLSLVGQNDCKTCHAEDKKINGPSYLEIANRYYGNPTATGILAQKVMGGGAGNWGETAMSAHPNLSVADATEIVKYILSLADDATPSDQISLAGKYKMEAHLDKEEKGAYVFQASYRDLGSRGVPSLLSKEMVVLRYPKIEAETFSKASKGVRKLRIPETDTAYVTDLIHGRFVGFEKLDLTGIDSLTLGFADSSDVLDGTTVEIHLDAPNGELAGTSLLKKNRPTAHIPLKATRGKHTVYLVFKNEKRPEQEVGRLDWVFFGKQKKVVK